MMRSVDNDLFYKLKDKASKIKRGSVAMDPSIFYDDDEVIVDPVKEARSSVKEFLTDLA
jgi:hypothetical protein